ncbi:MAG: 16S rRNA (guanine966-N2)-methyltransferase [Bacteroidia bacterium]|jgi:16S rRNA (guanine966-N2)-methyltransferase
MRIIAGKHKGLPIPMPKGGDIRPTTDRAKEALFSILASRYDFEEISVLDLFSGSGNVGFESVSRGCNNVTSIEKNRKVAMQAQTFAVDRKIKNIKFTSMDVFQFLKKCTQTFDIIFADPPYHLQSITSLPDLIEQQQLLNSNGLLIIEHESTLQWDHKHLIETRKYGQSVFSMFQFDVSLTE